MDKKLLLDQRTIQGYLSVDIEKKYPKGWFKTVKGCDILKL